jgi:hypothetical protein
MSPQASAAVSRRPALGAHHHALSLDTVWLLIAAAYPFVVLNFTSLSVDDGDFWWTLALGKFTWAAGTLPTTDPLPYTPTPVPYVQAQWLAALLLYGTYRLGGFELLLVLRAAIVAAAFALLYLGCRRAGAAPALAGLATLLTLPLVNVGLSLRPQLFALVPFMLYLEATRRPALGATARYVLPPVMVFWANVHGSFLFGLLLVGLALVARLIDLARPDREEQNDSQPAPGPGAGWASWPHRAAADSRVRALAVLLGLSALAPLANPYGLGFLGYLRDYLAVNPGHGELGGLLTEWLPTSLGTPAGPTFFVSLALLAGALYASGAALGAVRWPRQRLGTGEALRLLVFGWLALRWIRGIVWWGLVLPAPLAGMVQRGLFGAPAEQPARGSPPVNALLAGLALVVAVTSLPWWRDALPLGEPSIVSSSPLVVGTDRLAADAPRRLFHYIAWGPYLAWRLNDGGHIFIDGRFEAYRPEVFADYEAISRAAPGWDTRLASYDVDHVVLSRAEQPALVAAVASAPEWQETYADGDVVVYRRRGPS